MLSKKIELPVDAMNQIVGLAEKENLSVAVTQLSCEKGCIARILYMNTRDGHEALIRLMKHVHELELAQIKKAISGINLKRKLNLQLLKSKKQTK